jgi:hypothetical protein
MVQLLCKLITRQIDQFASSFKSLLSDLLNGPSARNDPRVPNRFDIGGRFCGGYGSLGANIGGHLSLILENGSSNKASSAILDRPHRFKPFPCVHEG